jgi:sulfatase maturation enzyme AslB (radical SAM superfamily)
VPALVAETPTLPSALERLMAFDGPELRSIAILHALCLASAGDIAAGLAAIAPLALQWSQSALVQGALFHLQGLADPDNPRYRLAGKICPAPFEQLDVLEHSTHQCCASWLHQSAGNLADTPWPHVWNSAAAQAVRASVLDGSYRYCNKTACPRIQANELAEAATVAARSPIWADVIAHQRCTLDRGPRVVNLAYDRTCNLACPSCRTERFAADDATRARFDVLQETAILPMLKTAEIVFVTGSGDPFASKNFRRLITALTVEDYPRLRFQIMTNGMLLTERQWAEFPTLHGRVAMLKISIDAACAATHETLRLGARWDTMLENIRFAGRLVAEGQIDQLDLVFVVQQANFREMGDAVDLARTLGATGIYFSRLTNWGTFSTAGYAARAVCAPDHPEHAAFLEAMRDPRLYDPIVLLGDLLEFAPEDARQARTFVH